MLRRIARAGSKVRLISASGALVAAAVALPGCVVSVSEQAGASGGCTSPALTSNVFVANRAVRFDVQLQHTSDYGGTTMICFRAKAGSMARGGRITVYNGLLDAERPSVDNNSRACATAENNQISTEHPIESGTVLGTPYYIDAFASLQEVWICFEADTLARRIKIPIQTGTIPFVHVLADPSPADPQPNMTPQAGRPSSSCSDGDYGTPAELINSHLVSEHVFLYTAQPSSTQMHICARIDGPAAGGVDLGVKVPAGQVVRLETSSVVTPCTQDVVTTSNPPLTLKVTPVGQLPPSICLNGTRYTVATGPVPLDVVDFEFD